MLTHLLRAQDCAACRLCCHFQRSSAWETPAIEPELVALYRELNPPPPLMERADGSITFALRFPPDDASAEAPCPMLDASSGCTLPREQRPFECRLWPLRLMRLLPEDESGAEPTTPLCRAAASRAAHPDRADGVVSDFAAGAIPASLHVERNGGAQGRPECTRSGSGDATQGSPARGDASERQGSTPAAPTHGKVVIGCYSACPGVPASLLPRLCDEALGPLRAALVEHARRLPQTIRPYDAHYVVLAELPELSEAGLREG